MEVQSFKAMVITNLGINLMAKVQAGRGGIQYTHFALGSGTYTGSESVAEQQAMTELRGKKQKFGITKNEYVNEATTKLTLAATNIDNTAGYKITEIGVYAQDPDLGEILYSVCAAEVGKESWFPAYNSQSAATVTYPCYISVSNSSTVTIKIGTGAVALQDDLVALTGRVVALEEGAAGMVGIKRKCADNGTPISTTTWERIGQAVGATAAYARGNEAVVEDLMEKWPFNKLRPCNLPLSEADPVAYLGDVDFDWYGKTGAAAGTNVMLEIPTEMYYSHFFEKDSDGQNWEYELVADSARYPFSVYIKDLMARSDGTKKDFFYFPIFNGSLDTDGKLRSVAGSPVAYNKSCTALRSAAKLISSSWQLIDEWGWDVFTALARIYSASSNDRTSFGRGCCDFGSSARAAVASRTSSNIITISNSYQNEFRVGQTINIGTAMWNASVAQDRTITAIAAATDTENAIDITFDGDAVSTTTASFVWKCVQITGSTIGMASANGTAGANDGKHSVRVLYTEDPYGMIWNGLDGVNLKFNSDANTLDVYYCKNPGNYADTYDNYTKAPALSMVLDPNATNFDKSGQVKKFLYDRQNPIIKAYAETVGEGAGSETYEAAYQWKRKNGQRPFVGADFSNGSNVSLRYRGCSGTFPNSNWYYGSRPFRR